MLVCRPHVHTHFFFFFFLTFLFFKNVLGLNNKVFTMEWKKGICFHINITCLLPVNKRRYKTFLFLSLHTVASYCREFGISIYWYCVPSQPSCRLTMFHVAAIPSTKQAELNFCFFLWEYPGKQKVLLILNKDKLRKHYLKSLYDVFSVVKLE